MSLALTADTSIKGLLAALDGCLRLKSVSDRRILGQLLLNLAKQARIDRRFDLLEVISDLICALLPDTDFSRTAEYYRALCLHHKGSTEGARQQLEAAIDLAPPKCKAGALLALAATYFDTGEISEFTGISKEAIKASRGLDILSEVHAQRNIAIACSLSGNHQTAFAVLESLSPITRLIAARFPTDRLSHLNSLAIELGELGRVDEANFIIDSILREPSAKHQSEWLDTKLELASKQQLVFPPFTMALGAPTDLSAQRETNGAPEIREATQPESKAKPTKDGKRHKNNLAKPNKRRSRERKPATAVCRVRAQDSIATPLSIPLSAEPEERNTHGLGFRYTPTERGHAMSPPARAPPARLRNSSTF